MNRVIAALAVCALTCASYVSYAESFPKNDRMWLRHPADLTKPSFVYDNDKILRFKHSSTQVQTGSIDADTGIIDASLDASDLDFGTIPGERIPSPGYVYEVALTDRPYSTISSALADATNPDVDKIILIYPGVYNEAVTVTVPRTHIQGASRAGVRLHKTVTDETAIIDIQADACSVNDVTLSCTRTSGDYGRCLRIGQQTTTPVIQSFLVRNCALFSNKADVFWAQDNVTSFTMTDCLLEGAYDILASSALKGFVKNCHIRFNELSDIDSSAIWLGDGVSPFPGQTLFVDGVFTEAPDAGTYIQLHDYATAYVTNASFYPTKTRRYNNLCSLPSGATIHYDASMMAAAPPVSFDSGTVVENSLLRTVTTDQTAPEFGTPDDVHIAAQHGRTADGTGAGQSGAPIRLTGGTGGDGEDDGGGHGGDQVIRAGSGGVDVGSGPGGNGGNVHVAAGAGGSGGPNGTSGTIHLYGNTYFYDTLTGMSRVAALSSAPTAGAKIQGDSIAIGPAVTNNASYATAGHVYIGTDTSGAANYGDFYTNDFATVLQLSSTSAVASGFWILGNGTLAPSQQVRAVGTNLGASFEAFGTGTSGGSLLLGKPGSSGSSLNLTNFMTIARNSTGCSFDVTDSAANQNLVFQNTNGTFLVNAAIEGRLGINTTTPPTSGAQLQTPSLSINGGTTLAGYLSNTATLDFGSISSASQAELTITVTGAAAGDTVSLGPPSGIESGLISDGRVSASNTVTVRLANITGSPIDPASATWRASVFKH